MGYWAGNTWCPDDTEAVAAAARRAAVQSLAIGINTADFDTSDYALGDALAPTVDLTNNRIQIGVGGLYRISGSAGIVPSAAAAGTTLRVFVLVNGSFVGTTSTPLAGTSEVVAEVHRTRYLSAGDLVSLQVYQDTAAAQDSLANVHNSLRLEVVLVR